jgi:hypothetical protein
MKLTPKKPVKIIYSDDEDSENEEHEELDEDELNYEIKKKLGKVVHSTRSYDVHFPKMEKFVSNMEPYSYNQKLNKNHVKQIKTAYLKSKHDIQGTFITCTDITGKIYLLDGHHRYKALTDIYNKKKNKKNFNIEPQVHNYKIENIHSASTRELFNRINKVKPFNNDEEIIRHCHNIIALLKDKYPNRFKENCSSVKFPNVLISDVVVQLRRKFKEMDVINDNQIIDEIYATNIKLATKTYEGLRKHRNITEKQHDKMDEHEFYLSVLCPSKWF